MTTETLTLRRDGAPTLAGFESAVATEPVTVPRRRTPHAIERHATLSLQNKRDRPPAAQSTLAAVDHGNEVSLFDLFVILAAATVALAFGTALTLHAQVEILPAVAASLVAYAGLVVGHILVARGRRPDDRVNPADTHRRAAASRAQPTAPKRDLPIEADTMGEQPQSSQPVLSRPVSPASVSGGRPESLPRHAFVIPEAFIAPSTVSETDSMEPTPEEAAQSFERLQALVARMAAEVKAAEQAVDKLDRTQPFVPLPSVDAEPLPAMSQPLFVPPTLDVGTESTREPVVDLGLVDGRLDTAVAALSGALAEMQAAQPHAAQTLAGGSRTKPPTKRRANPEIDALIEAGALGFAVATAIADQRVRMYLEPVQGLTDAKPRHVEVTMRLLGQDGVELEADAVATVARQTGLMAAFDALKLPRAVRVARHFKSAAHDGVVLAGLEGSTLADDEFRETAALALDRHEGARVLLAFAQSDVQAFGPIHWQSLHELVRFGVRFALSGVAHLDMNFEQLRALGFEFVKLDAATYLNGLPAPIGVIPAADVVRLFTAAGLTPIVDGIADVTALIQVQASGVTLGQGALFGAPKPVRAEVLAAGQRAA